MNKLKKSLLITGAVASVGIGSLAAVGAASAASNTNQQSLVDKIASKFSLNKGEVQAVFDQNQQERQAEHLQNLKDRLATYVKDGKLTQEQADKIVAKVQEMQTERETNRDKFEAMAADERKAAMEKNREELKQWLSDNGISTSYEHMLFGGPHRGGHGPNDQDE